MMPLAELAETLAAAHPGESGFRILDHGADAFAARAMLADRAESTLDLQYYLVHDGQTTRLLAAALLRAADRGVKVRLLLDDTLSHGRDFDVVKLSAHSGIEVRLFNPLRSTSQSVVARSLAVLTQLNRLHRRMHNKLWIADSAVAISGGRNLGDEYFSADDDINFADIDLLSVGPVAAELAASFDAYWHSEHAVPVEQFLERRLVAEDLRRVRAGIRKFIAGAGIASSAWARRLRERAPLVLADDTLLWARAHAIWDHPDKIVSPGMPPSNQMLEAELLPLFSQVKGRLMLVSAYFVPGEDGMTAIREMRARGVDVRVMTNSLEATDVPFVYGAYAPYRRPLLECGVELREMKARLGTHAMRRRVGIWGRAHASLHTKAMVFDGTVAFVGSYNMDPRSRFWNTEVGVLVHSPLLARELETILDEAFRPDNSYRLGLDGEAIVYREQDRLGQVRTVRQPAGPWKRFQSWVSDRIGPREFM